MRVENMQNASGNNIANQFLVWDNEGNCFFQSYKSIIAKNDVNGKITLDLNTWNYSRTTAKYRSQFLGESTKETQNKIKSGIYKLENLN